MSQEEEKLIDSFYWKIVQRWAISHDEEDYEEFTQTLFKIYRSGKLAGFEVCEKLGIQIEGLRVEDGFLWIKIPYQKFGESGLSFSIITSSLIEEEKKKL